MRTFVSSILLVATMLSLVNASLNDIDEQHQRRRDLLLRGVAGENRADHDRQLGSDDKQKDRSFDVTQLQDELGEVLYLYQMDTTYIYAASPHDDHDNDHYADPVTQPFYKPLEHGASGVLAYRSAGWEFLYTFVGRNLRPGASYELIYYPSIADPALLNITCIASGVVGNIGGLSMIGMISGFPSMPMPSDRNRNNGAKIWLVPSSDIDCTAVNKTIIDSPNYAMYMFSGEKEFLNYDYLGD